MEPIRFYTKGSENGQSDSRQQAGQSIGKDAGAGALSHRYSPVFVKGLQGIKPFGLSPRSA